MRLGWVFALVAGCSDYGIGVKPPAVDPPVPVIAVDPSALDFGVVPLSQTAELPFTVSNVGTGPLTLGPLSVLGTFTLGADPSGAVLDPGEEVTGSVRADGSPAERFGQVDLPSDDPATAIATIDLHASPGLPGLLIDPDPVDLGLVEVGADATAEVTLTNTGVDPLDLTTAAVGEPFWLGRLDPITLVPGESRTMNVHFTPVEPIPYASRLVFTIAQLGDAPVDVIGAGNSTPKAVCAAAPVNPILPDETVTWIGSGSSDPAGRPLTYAWSLVAAPAGSTAVLHATSADVPGFAPDELGPYTAELVVTNDLGQSATCQADITAVDTKPIAVCSVAPNPAQAIVDRVTWSGAGSSDPAGGALTYDWSLAAKPTGSTVLMPWAAATKADRSGFTADLAGTYTGKLVVTNPFGVSSDPCLVNLEVIPAEDLWVEMYWSNSGEDMDLHLVRDAGSLRTSQDCYYANCVGGLGWGPSGADGNPSLDLDDIPGTGPENINIATPENLVYHVWVNDYPLSVRTAATSVTVNIYLSGVLAWTGTQSISGEDVDAWFADIDWTTQTVTP